MSDRPSALDRRTEWPTKQASAYYWPVCASRIIGEATVRSLGPQACLADNTQKRIAWRVSAPVPVPETS